MIRQGKASMTIIGASFANILDYGYTAIRKNIFKRLMAKK